MANPNDTPDRNRTDTTSANGDPPLSPCVLTLDYERYAPYLDDADLSEEQKREYLQALWSVVCSFVALGFGVHPVTHAGAALGSSCGKIPETGFDKYSGASNMTSLPDITDNTV